MSRATFILLEVVGIGVMLHHRNARTGKPEDAKRQAGAQRLPINVRIFKCAAQEAAVLACKMRAVTEMWREGA